MDRYTACFERIIEESFKNGFKGIDPYDFASSTLKLPHFALSKLSFINKVSPINMRPLLNIAPSENSQSNALFLHALLLTNPKKYIKEIDFLYSWLKKNKSAEFPQYSLGFAFEMALTRYSSGPGKTSLIISLFAMFAFLDYYRISHEEGTLRLIRSFEGLLEGNWLKYEDNETLWYSYLPNQKDEVPNATAKVGRFYALYHGINPTSAIKNKLVKILNYLERIQNMDGSWAYSVKNPYVDNFHTAFVLESIHQMHRIVKTKASERMFNIGLADYIENCFNDGTPLHFHKVHFPKDIRRKLIYTEIRDLANAIILFSKIGMLDKAQSILDFALDKYYDTKGGFFYFFNNKLFTSKINYVRWQSWMLLAISEFSKNKKVYEKN